MYLISVLFLHLATANVKVLPATKIERGPEIPASMELQQNVTLECVVQNFPVWRRNYNGVISWKKDGEDIDESNDRIWIDQDTYSLTITNLTYSDSGNMI